LGRLNGGLTGMASKGANLDQLNKEIEMASADYTQANEQLTMAQNMGAVPGNFRQTIIGEPALKPEPSKKLIILSLAGISGLVLSSLSIIFLEFFDSSIKTPGQFTRSTGLPLLGVVNRIHLQNNLPDQVLDHGKKNRANLFRELLRKLRYELADSNKKVILFTSTEPQQGKTTLIQALAYSLSLGKKQVLIIDTNFCNNDITLQTNASPKLEQFQVQGENFDFERFKDFISKTSVEGVDVIGCEGGDYTPTEILPKKHLLNYLGELKKHYDYIFLEGAPLNGFTDSRELVNYADGIIGVFSAETIVSPSDKESIHFFEQHRNKFIGAILNKVLDNNLDL
ncbi:MAG: AAA family ATPase, partial [Flavitalea sp.]